MVAGLSGQGTAEEIVTATRYRRINALASKSSPPHPNAPGSGTATLGSVGPEPSWFRQAS